MITPRISILIPHYNDLRIIECLKELNKTSFREKLKVIIQDSQSDKVIVDKIRNNLRPQDRLIIKKDKGIFDGLNHLLSEIDTEYFTWIGCDDFITEEYNIDAVLRKFENGENIVQSNVIYFDKTISNPTRVIKAYDNNFLFYSLGLPFYHFGSTIRSELIHKSKLQFNITRKTAADFEFFRKLLMSSKSVKCNDSTVFLGDGGNSSSSIKARLNGYSDIIKSFLNLRILILPLFLTIRFYFKIKSKIV